MYHKACLELTGFLADSTWTAAAVHESIIAGSLRQVVFVPDILPHLGSKDCTETHHNNLDRNHRLLLGICNPRVWLQSSCSSNTRQMSQLVMTAKALTGFSNSVALDTLQRLVQVLQLRTKCEHQICQQRSDDRKGVQWQTAYHRHSSSTRSTCNRAWWPLNPASPNNQVINHRRLSFVFSLA